MGTKILDVHELAIRLEENKSNIVRAFVEISRKNIPPSRSEPESTLKDHLPELLGKVASYLLSRGSSYDKAAISALAFMHGKVRSNSKSEYMANDLRAEFAIVRKQILSLLRDDEELCKEGVSLFTESCECIMSSTIESFTLERSPRIRS